MQHVRGLVRAHSRSALRRLEHATPHAVGTGAASAGNDNGDGDKACVHDTSPTREAAATTTTTAVSSCLVPVRLVDCMGACAHATLLRPLHLMQAAWQMPRDDALRCVQAVQARLRAANDTTVLSWQEQQQQQQQLTLSSQLPLLYVKDSVRAMRDEVAQRQHRQLAYVYGRLLAHDLDAVTTFVQSLQQQQQQQQQTPRGATTTATAAAAWGVYTAEQMATYNGVVEELCVRAYTTAVALAIDSRMPPLQSRTARQLALAVDVRSRDAVCSFLDGFAVRDEAVPACETCATQLALRLRTSLAQLEQQQQQQQQDQQRAGDDADTVATRRQLRALLRECARYNIDPSVVYTREATSLQQWATRCVLHSNVTSPAAALLLLRRPSRRLEDAEQAMHPRVIAQQAFRVSPHERTAALLHTVQSRRLLPRRVSVDALSVWCMSDLARPWLASALGKCGGDKRDSSSSNNNSTHDSSSHNSDALALSVVAQRDATAFALRDARRNLVDTGLLHHYAALLARGDISVVNDDDHSRGSATVAADDHQRTGVTPHDSFAAFLEQCGECHDARARPRRLSFTMPAPRRGGHSIATALRRLAPYCAYWCTLLDHFADDAVRVYAAPFGDVRVDVELPATHECVRVARDLVAATTTTTTAHACRHDGSNSSGDCVLRDAEEAAAVQALLSAAPSLTTTSSRSPLVLYGDDDVLVLNKPAGVATSRHALCCTQLGRAVTDVVSVLMASRRRSSSGEDDNDNDVAAALPRQGLVHRLDKGTSGCLVVARSTAAADGLRHQMGTSAAFTYGSDGGDAAGLSGHGSKVYLALCAVVEPDLGAVPLHGTLADPADARVVTRYRVVRFARASRLALVQCRLTQGKKHQVRRHLAAAGLPLIGDVEHGGFVCTRPLLRRPALHACSVAFAHPTRAGHVVRACAPLPHDFRRALAALD